MSNTTTTLSGAVLNVHTVYRLYQKCISRDFIFLIPLVSLSLYVRLRYYFYLRSSGVGFPQAADSKWYLDYAHNLMTNFTIGTHMNDILYIGYNLLLTILLAIFKDPATILFIQAVTASLCVILVYKITRMLFNRTAAFIAAVFYSYLWDITLWATYILTDSFFISLLLLCVYLLLKCYESDKKIVKVLFIFSLIYLAFFRPAGLLSVAFILLYIVLRLPRKTVFDFLKKHKLALGGAVTAVLVLLVYLIAGHKLNSLITSMQFNAKMVLYNIYAKGWIYDHPTPYDYKYRPDYTINVWNSLILSFIINNWDHILHIYGKRTVAFLGRWVWQTDLSSLFGIKVFLKNMLPAFLFMLGTIAAMWNGAFRKAAVIWYVILAVFIFCIIFFIDGMYRYKAPSSPFIAIAAGYGLERIIRGTIIIAKKMTGKLLWNNKGKFSS